MSPEAIFTLIVVFLMLSALAFELLAPDVIVFSALGLSAALTKTGAASFLAEYVIKFSGGLGPLGLLAAIYLVTSLATEVITNNAAAALIFPIAIVAASQAGLAPMPFVIAIAVAASASFATPIGYQTNLDGLWPRRVPVPRLSEGWRTPQSSVHGHLPDGYSVVLGFLITPALGDQYDSDVGHPGYCSLPDRTIFQNVL